MKRTLVTAAILALFLGVAPILNLIDGLLPFDRPALTGEPCDTLPWSEVQRLNLDFEGRTAHTRGRVNGVQVHASWGERGLGCRQLWRRADCTATGPLHVRALSDEASAYFRIQDGQTARIRAHRGRIRCVVNPTEPQPPSSASQ